MFLFGIANGIVKAFPSGHLYFDLFSPCLCKSFYESFPYLPVGGLSEWPANAHLPRFVGFHCRCPAQARGRPTNILLQLKGALGIQVLLSPATLTIPVAKLARIEMNASGLIFASCRVVKFGRWLLPLKCC